MTKLEKKKRRLAANPRDLVFSLRFNSGDIEKWNAAVTALRERSGEYWSLTDCVEAVLNRWAKRVLENATCIKP